MSIVYRRFGGSTHVRVDTFAQLKEAVNVPETQWVATSAPLVSFAADARFLALLDSDNNGRIRVDELQAAVAWLSSMLGADAGVDARSATLTLDHLTPAAGAVKAAALTILDVVGAADRASVTLEQVRAAETPLRAAGRNGDGIVAPAQVPTTAQALATQIVSLFPEVKNRAGLPGVSPEHLAAFRTARASFVAHLAARDGVFVWGEHSLARAQQVQAVTDVLDEHFLLCRLVASQPDARERFRLAADRIESLVGNRSAMQAALASLPVAPPDPAGVLAFSTLHRGPHLEALQAFAADVLPLAGADKQLTEATWTSIKGTAAAILAWQHTYDTHQLCSIAASIASISDAELDAIEQAQRKDLDDKAALDAIGDLEKVVLLQRYLLAFANSFLSMPDLYTNNRALYERGHAILAGRRYELSLLVPDVGAHKAHTEQGTTCVVYARVFDKEGGAGFDVVLPKTRGWSNELVVGKRGLFYDLDNQEHDLIVTHIVRQPVSVMEAGLTPFLRIGEFLNKKLESLNAGVDEAVDQHSAALGKTFDGTKAAAAAALTKGPQPALTAPAPAAPSQATGVAGPAMGNALAMGGLAVAAVGSSVAFIAAQLKALSVADLISIVVLGFAAIAGPSGFVGWLKLRRRNLAQLLEGAGWALNDRLRVTPQLAARVTQTPSWVAGSSLEIVASPPVPGEPEDSHLGWKIAAIVAVVLFVFWQVREPLLRVGCHNGQVPSAICVAAGLETRTETKTVP